MPSTLIAYLCAALAGWGVVAPVTTYFVTQWKTRVEATAACNIRVAKEVRSVSDKLNADADEKVAEAIRAAESVTPTPTAPADLVALCANDSSCRERAKK